jgi:phosphatidylglycerol:prolipoprotein diacylglycerol transferase
MIVSPQIQSVSLFGINIYFYGMILSFAIFVGFSIVDKLVKTYYQQTFVYEQAIILTLSGLLGARFYFCILNYSYYIQEPLKVFNIREGGLSIHGAIILGVITLAYLSKTSKIKALNLTDVYAVAFPLSQSIGRFGNYFNSEAYGLPTNLPWKLYIAPHYRPLKYINCSYFHPTFLYESILDVILFAVLFFIYKKYHKKTGLTSGLYLILYSIIRLLVEPLRIDCTSYICGIPLPIIMSFIMILVGSALIFISQAKLLNN